MSKKSLPPITNSPFAIATVIEQFEQQVQSTPDAIAIVFEDQELSFLHLDQLANRFAHTLRRLGVHRGEAVGLCIDRRPEAIASMLGAFKIGAVYVPLDPEYPAERIRYMIDDADLRVIVTHDRNTNSLACSLFELCNTDANPSFEICWIDSASESFSAESVDPVHDLPNPDDLAYIMYTSGSTGMPKGVQIEHRALAVYCDADRQIYELTSCDRTLQFSTLNFDIAIEEIFPPLLTGGTVVIRPQLRSASGNELSSIIDRYQVTGIHIATAYWHEWVDLMIASQSNVPASLRLVIATGEKVSVEHYRRWNRICRQDVKWCNAYGPTETTVTATVFIPEKSFDDDNMPIGKPLVGYEAFILDDSLRPVETGQTGQLFIGGLALARGYHKNISKTEAAFLTVDLPARGPTRIYRTGDLARWLPSGDIEFAGRVDHQIKVGSYRIEPGEIEVAIAKFPEVLESIVVHQEIAGQKFLIAYVAVGQAEMDLKQLQAFLRTILPVYMIPSRFVILAALPKTINGKVDRHRLPPPATAVALVSDDVIEPCCEMEQKLKEIWQAVLHFPTVGTHDDFFALGGSSLLVTRVVALVASQIGVELPVRDLFANPTIASCASHIRHLINRQNGIPDSQTTPRDRIQPRSRLPLITAKMIRGDGGNLFTVLYQPRDKRHQHGVLICNSMGHEHARAYRNLQQLALQLADAGFDVLRFDYRGTGNSSGDCEFCNAESLGADTRSAANYFRDESSIKQLSLLGIRLGATIAATAKVQDVEALILWDPVVEGEPFVGLLDRFHNHALTSHTRFSRRLSRTGREQAYGHAMGPAKRKSLRQLNLPALPIESATRNLLLCSDGYRESEPGMNTIEKQWTVTGISDAIDWHHPDFTERAFSSPAAYKAILGCLSDGVKEPEALRNPMLPSFSFPVGYLGQVLS